MLVAECGRWRCGRTAALIKNGKLPDVSTRDAQKNYKKALEKGILKILSKMGISLLSCYHGAQIFEVRHLFQCSMELCLALLMPCLKMVPACCSAIMERRSKVCCVYAANQGKLLLRRARPIRWVMARVPNILYREC